MFSCLDPDGEVWYPTSKEPPMWEKIDESTHRMKVPGGWIVRATPTWAQSISVHMVYVPDSDHTWVLPK